MDVNSLAHTKWDCKYHIVFAPKYRRQVIYKDIKADVGQILVQILLERYAYSEIGGTFILIWRYAFSTQNGTFFLYYCDVTIIHHSAKEELLCTTTILFLES